MYKEFNKWTCCIHNKEFEGKANSDSELAISEGGHGADGTEIHKTETGPGNLQGWGNGCGEVRN